MGAPMSIKADLHLHTHFSSDCKTPMEAMIEKGIALGLDQICFTDHLDYDFVINPNSPEKTFLIDLPAYRKECHELKEKYATSIEVLFGLELGLQTSIQSQIDHLMANERFDFVIGSSHLCNGKDPYYPPFYEGRPEEEAYTEYFNSIINNAKLFSCFQVYGHLDYVVRYGPNRDTNYTYEKYKDVLDEILITLISKGKGIEVNTGGYRKGLRELHPLTAIIKRYKELGGELITVGSDSHVTDHMTTHFNLAHDILISCGFKYYSVFREQKPYFYPL